MRPKMLLVLLVVMIALAVMANASPRGRRGNYRRGRADDDKNKSDDSSSGGSGKDNSGRRRPRKDCSDRCKIRCVKKYDAFGNETNCMKETCKCELSQAAKSEALNAAIHENFTDASEVVGEEIAAYFFGNQFGADMAPIVGEVVANPDKFAHMLEKALGDDATQFLVDAAADIEADPAPAIEELNHLLEGFGDPAK